MISHDHRCIFVHIPKCAGSTVERIVWPGPRTEAELYGGFIDAYHNRYQTGGLQHLLARHIRQEVGDEVFRTYLKFTIVRNPWDRAVSQFTYMARRADLRDFLGLRADDDFSTYLRLLPQRDHVQWKPQSEFVTDDSGEVIVDRILRTERLDEQLPPLLEEIGIRIDRPIPQIKRTRRDRDHRSYYSDEDRAFVAQFYREDIERFGNRF